MQHQELHQQNKHHGKKAEEEWPQVLFKKIFLNAVDHAVNIKAIEFGMKRFSQSLQVFTGNKESAQVSFRAVLQAAR
jgi:hypothetical protein